MKRFFLKTPLLLLPLALASCGGGSSAPSAADYFSAYEAAAKTSLSSDSVGMRCDSYSGKMDFKNVSEGAETHFSVRMERGAYDFRLSGLNALTSDAVTASFKSVTSLNTAGGKLYLDGDVPAFISGIVGGTGLPLNVSSYLESDVAYLDLSKAAWLRLAIQGIIQDEADPEYKLPQRVKFTAEDTGSIDEYLPLSKQLNDAVAESRKTLEKAYETTPNEFSFLQSGEEKLIVFSSTSWSSFRALFDAFAPTSESYSGSFDVSSIFDEAEEMAKLTRFRLSLSFLPEGLRHYDVDVALSFNQTEPAEEGISPEGTWSFAMGADVVSGEAAKPLTLTAAEKSKYEEFVVPEKLTALY